MTRKPKTFIVRELVNERGHHVWQVGQDVCGDASYYLGRCALRWFDRFVKRGMTPIFENGATTPIAD
jgi:hypothetical protein